MFSFFRKYPLFLYFLSLFFVLHGYTENFGIVPSAEALVLLLKYISFAIVLSFLFFFFYKNLIKASLVVFFIMAYNFFFGKLHDISKNVFGNFLFNKYSFIIPVSFLLLILLILYFKKTNKEFISITKYLNWLFLILILMDAGNLVLKVIKNNQSPVAISQEFTDCNACPKPDIYLIVADEYAGQTQLKDLFGFDNAPFLAELEKRNFHVVSNSSANYNFTEYSIASLLNMNYLTGVSEHVNNLKYLPIVLNTLKKSRALGYFLSQGYSFYNYSIFDFNNHLAPVPPTFLPLKTISITSQTFTTRIQRDLGYHLLTTLKIKKILSDYYYKDLNNNNKIYELTESIASKKTKNPKFIYTHLVMPHYRYYFDSNSQPVPFEKIINDAYCKDKNSYIEYLQYTNKKLLALIDHIKKSSDKPPVIILMSDHGYRQFKNNEPEYKEYQFMNLNAVYFPDKNYSLLYNNISNVNQFRVILNSLFQQKIPLLKDSTIFLDQ